MGKTKAMTSRLLDDSTWSDMLRVSSGQCCPASTRAGRTTASQSRPPARVKHQASSGAQRTRKGSGSISGSLRLIGLSRNCLSVALRFFR